MYVDVGNINYISYKLSDNDGSKKDSELGWKTCDERFKSKTKQQASKIQF